MALNLYTTRDDVKSRAGLPDTDDDAKLDAVILAVSREIDSWCGRQFWSYVQTRHLTSRTSDLLVLPPGTDLLSVTTLKTDDDGDRTYETTWATTDYDLEPEGAADASPPGPYWQVATTPEGRYAFPTHRRGVQVVGRWGYSDVLTLSAATLAEDLDASETAVDVSSGTAFKIGQVLVIDSERLEISAISTNTLTVSRGVNGSTAATHSNGAAIAVATFGAIAEAAINQALLVFRGSTAAPLGIQGSPEYGQQIRGTGLHPFVQKMLAPFRVPRVG